MMVFVFSDPIAAVFNSEQNDMLQKIAVHGIHVYFTALFFMGFNIVLSSYFASIERAVPAHILSITRGLIFVIPAAYILSALAELTGVWLAVPVAEGMACMVGIVMYVRMNGMGRQRGMDF